MFLYMLIFYLHVIFQSVTIHGTTLFSIFTFTFSYLSLLLRHDFPRDSPTSSFGKLLDVF